MKKSVLQVFAFWEVDIYTVSGGFSKADSTGAYLLSTIEMLDLWI